MPDRALLVTPDYPPRLGGIARLLDALVTATQPVCDWRVVTTVEGPSTADVQRVRGHAALERAALAHARWLAKADRPLVVCGHLHVAGEARSAAVVARAPMGLLVYGAEIMRSGPRHRVARACSAGKRVVAISASSAEHAVRAGFRAGDVRVVHPNLRPDARATVPQSRDPGTGLRLVCVTRLTESYKNLELVLRAAALLGPTGAVADVTIVGDGPRRAALEHKAAELEVSDLVHFVGAVSDSERFDALSHAHVGLFPSRETLGEGSEGYGLVTQEMAAAGLPVLAGRAGGTVDAVDDAWGILLDPDELRAWVVELQALADDEPRRLRMGAAGIAWAEALDPGDAPRRLLEALAS
jgi:glycosyltransferase involved in cell wall biosynthesis